MYKSILYLSFLIFKTLFCIFFFCKVVYWCNYSIFIQTLQFYETGIAEARGSTSYILKRKNTFKSNIYNL